MFAAGLEGLEAPISNSDTGGYAAVLTPSSGKTLLFDVAAVALWVCCVVLVVLTAFTAGECVGTTVGAGACYAAYLVVCFYTKAWTYLRVIISQEEAEEHLKELRNTRPTIELRIECYSAGQDKGPAIRTTGSAIEYFPYPSCCDETPPFPGFHARLTSLHVSSPTIYMDEAMQELYVRQKASFRTVHDTDTFYELTEAATLPVPGVSERMLVVQGPSTPMWLGRGQYILSAVLGLAPLYHVVLWTAAVQAQFQLVKVLEHDVV